MLACRSVSQLERPVLYGGPTREVGVLRRRL